MMAERVEFLSEQTERHKGNGFRQGHNYGYGRKQEFKIPCDRFDSVKKRKLTR